MADVLDVLIVGGGAAGYTAGIFAARDRRRALLLEKFSSGGQVLNCEHITNFPGFPRGVAGYTLGPLLQEQATAAGLQVAMNEATAVHRDGDLLRVETDGGAHTTRTLIVASGSRFTTLGVPGEEAFVGRGISHCASCDGSFFTEKPVIVVGGGDAAVDEAIHLTHYASSVTVLHRRETLRACASLQERGRGERRLSFRWNTVLRAIEGSDGVERVQVEDVKSGTTATLDASGVFIYAGLTPNTEFLGGLVPLDAHGQIVTDLRMRTRVPGVLAAGDVRAESARQLVASAGDGATAALAAVQYLRDHRWATAGDHAATPVVGEWDAGDLGCGELVLELHVRLDTLKPGQIMKLTARDPGAPADIPAWCRMTGHALVGGQPPVYLIRRKEN